VPGDLCQFAAFVFTENANIKPFLGIRFYTSALATISNDLQSDSTYATGIWYAEGFASVAPATAAYWAPFIRANVASGSRTGSIFIDDVNAGLADPLLSVGPQLHDCLPGCLHEAYWMYRKWRTLDQPTNRYGPGRDRRRAEQSGRGHPRPFHASGLAMNRGVNQHGQLGFDLAYRDTVGYVSQPDRLRGKWVSWTHPTLGLWSGMVIDVRPDPDTGIIDCTAFGFSWKFRRRVTPKLMRAISGPPGAIVSSVLTSVGNDDPLPIAGIDAEESGIRSPISRAGRRWTT
jgi:hypothetical protein